MSATVVAIVLLVCVFVGAVITAMWYSLQHWHCWHRHEGQSEFACAEGVIIITTVIFIVLLISLLPLLCFVLVKGAGEPKRTNIRAGHYLGYFLPSVNRCYIYFATAG